MNEIAVVERHLDLMQPDFAEVLPAVITPQRLKRTIIISLERTPKLLETSRQSIFNSAMSAAILGLEVDGVTGQGFLIPFKRTCQLLVGYKGYNTMAARSGYTLDGNVVREGDHFDYRLGSNPFVDHRPELGGESNRKVIGAWAIAFHLQRPPVVVVMSIDELEEIKTRAPGARKPDSPWNQPGVPYAAMCAKTAKRRLARGMPLSVMQQAAAMEQAVEEQGRAAHVTRDGVIVDGETLDQPVLPQVSLEGRYVVHTAKGDKEFSDRNSLAAFLHHVVSRGTDEQKRALVDLNKDLLIRLEREKQFTDLVVSLRSN